MFSNLLEEIISWLLEPSGIFGVGNNICQRVRTDIGRWDEERDGWRLDEKCVCRCIHNTPPSVSTTPLELKMTSMILFLPVLPMSDCEAHATLVTLLAFLLLCSCCDCLMIVALLLMKTVSRV